MSANKDCPKCGAPTTASDYECAYCGAHLKDRPVIDSVKSTTKPSDVNPMLESAPKSKKSNMFIILSVVITVITGLIYLMSSNKTDDAKHDANHNSVASTPVGNISSDVTTQKKQVKQTKKSITNKTSVKQNAKSNSTSASSLGDM